MKHLVNHWRLLSIGSFFLVLLCGLIGGLLLVHGGVRQPFDLSVIIVCSGVAWWATERTAALAK